jgi:hypothetical protein
MRAGAAAEIPEIARRELTDSRQQIEAGTQALVAVFEILSWIPAHHRNP